MTEGLLAKATESWLLDRALDGAGLADVLVGLCARVDAAGVPVCRAVIAWPTLHPLFDAETLNWTRGRGVVLHQMPHHPEERPEWLASPLRHLLVGKLDWLRRRLDGPDAVVDFPLLAELAAEGITDYVAVHIVFDAPRAAGEEDRGCLVTWATDRPGGFTESHLAFLAGLRRGIGIVARTALLSRIATNIAETYLGRRAGGDVLAGSIRRGDGHAIEAVIWYSDLRRSTALAERLPRDAFLALLNRYFECTAGAVETAGGEVLEFIGDAVLAVFPIVGEADAGAAVRAATAAADDALARLAALGGDEVRFGVALAVGEVMFGNIGIPARLAFSVIGPTVNAVARIEAATKLIGAPVLATAAVAAVDPDGWHPVGAHALAGFAEPVELYARAR